MPRSRWAIAALVGLTGALSTATVLQAEPTTSPSTASATLAVKKLSVNGMTCLGCVQAVEAALKQVAGVSAVEVSLKGNEAVVEYDPAQVEPEALVVAVTESGFEGALKETEPPDAAELTE